MKRWTKGRGMGWGVLAALSAWIGLGTPAVVGATPAAAAFSEDFSQQEVGKLPPGFMRLEGQFAVREEGKERYLELPGAPLESFGVMFGASQKENWSASARFHGTGQGRRFPVFGLSLNGVAGYRLQVAPAKKAVEILRDDVVQASAPFNWASGEWTYLRIEVRKAGDATWEVKGKAWLAGTPEPADWMLQWSDQEAPPAGRAAIWGKPFSGTPIRFDDLKIETLNP